MPEQDLWSDMTRDPSRRLVGHGNLLTTLLRCAWLSRILP